MAAKQVASDYDRRIRRAEYLASVHPFAQEVLSFYTRLAEFQKKAHARVVGGRGTGAAENAVVSEDFELRAEELLPSFEEFLRMVAEYGPRALAESARSLCDSPSDERAERLRDYWSTRGCDESPTAAFDQFLPRAFLQPYAEELSSGLVSGAGGGTPPMCPRCGARPLLGVLRLEGDGGKRFLLCSFCLHEWEFRRILCATCGEETEAKLPVYVAEQFRYIRVEACETCKFYLRTIDLTADGNAVPVVDDLAAIPLSLWAEEHGYARAQPNLLGT